MLDIAYQASAAKMHPLKQAVPRRPNLGPEIRSGEFPVGTHKSSFVLYDPEVSADAE